MKKFTFQLGLIFCAVWFSGCKTSDDRPTYQDVHDSILFDGAVELKYLDAIESGNLTEAKRKIRTTLFLNVSRLSNYEKKFPMSVEEKNDANAFAKETLNYMWEHRKEIKNSHMLSVPGTLDAFPQLLTDKSDLERLQELSDFFNKTVSQ